MNASLSDNGDTDELLYPKSDYIFNNTHFYSN